MTPKLITKLRELVKAQKDISTLATILSHTPALLDAVEEMDSTLQFYANEKHYDESGACGKSIKSFDGEITEYHFEPDMGYEAKKTLAKVNKILGE